MNELVSVIISTYKRDNELERAINSVINQTYKNIEIIVVDDNGYNSEYQKRVQKIIDKFSNYSINYIVNKNNVGGALSRNNGIYEAKGRYIAFLDDDDEYYTEKVEEQLNLLESNNRLALVYCYTESFDENNKKIKEYKNDYSGNCLAQAMYDCIAATSQWMCRKDSLLKVGCFSDVPSKQDSTVIIKLLNAGFEIGRVPKILVRYNEHCKSRISSGGINNIKGELALRNLCRSLYNEITSTDILGIESSFSYRLSKLYMKNRIYDTLYEELKTVRYIDKIKWIKLIILGNIYKIKYFTKEMWE